MFLEVAVICQCGLAHLTLNHFDGTWLGIDESVTELRPAEEQRVIHQFTSKYRNIEDAIDCAVCVYMLIKNEGTLYRAY